jgi:hypothetical protein
MQGWEEYSQERLLVACKGALHAEGLLINSFNNRVNVQQLRKTFTYEKLF